MASTGVGGAVGREGGKTKFPPTNAWEGEGVRPRPKATWARWGTSRERPGTRGEEFDRVLDRDIE